MTALDAQEIFRTILEYPRLIFLKEIELSTLTVIHNDSLRDSKTKF